MSQLPSTRERFDDLAIQRSLHGLTDEEQKEMDGLRQEYSLNAEPTFDCAIAALVIGLNAAPAAQLPVALRNLIVQQGERMVAADVETGDSLSTVRPLSAQRAPRSTGTGALPDKLSTREKFWMFATAASLLLAAFFWMSDRPDRTSVRQLSLQESRENLIEKPGTVRVAWSVNDPTGGSDVAGDIVWNDEKQEGYMRFVGLRANDPQVEQYQLWIFDVNQDPATPVDGGVFDIPETGEVIVPIDPKLKVKKATMFAVTIEQPGGVPRSNREKLPLLATL